MNFAEAFKNEADKTYTENGGCAFNTTNGGDLLDLFANIGGMRNRPDSDIIESWLAARRENENLADNLVLYARNIRNGGLGERRIGRLLLKELARLNPEKVTRNLNKIVECGRWDDLFILEGTSIEDSMWKFIEAQFRADVKNMKENKPITLLAKWMPSINTSSNEAKRLANKFCKKFGVTPRTYRKALSSMRKYIDVVEKKMSAGQWDEINFEGVPSVAMSRYISTFNKRIPEKFQEYKNSLVKGEAKVNAATLYPYDIVKKYFTNGKCLDQVDESQWKALPNFINGDYEVVCLADVSGSMIINNYEPISTSIGLATYFAQRNKGAYHNMYLTFTTNPSFIKISDSWSLKRTLEEVRSRGIGYSTNLDAAMKAIFDVAVKTRDVPKALVVISDMEINSWMGQNSSYCTSIADKWEKMYKQFGLESPKLILWNVESRGGRVLAQSHEKVGFCSGYGIGPFKNLTSLIEKSAYEAMVEILSKPAFQWD